MDVRSVAKLGLCLISCAVFGLPQQATRTNQTPSAGKHFSPPAARMQEKLDFLERNAASNPISPKPTQLNEDEVNAWVAEGGLKLPTGVKQAVFHGSSGVIHADARVDFDQITAGKYSMNPLLALFSGTHDINVTAAADAAGGMGHVHVQTVSLDGVEIPRIALEAFINRYLKPKYPNIGMDSSFKMPARIDSATVGNHYVVLMQR
jgi:hypothetical protein